MCTAEQNTNVQDTEHFLICQLYLKKTGKNEKKTQKRYRTFPKSQKASSWPFPINILPRRDKHYSDFQHHRLILPIQWNIIQPLKRNKVWTHVTTEVNFENIMPRTSLVVQWLGLCTSTSGGTGSIRAQGTKISYATGKKKRKYYAK